MIGEFSQKYIDLENERLKVCMDLDSGINLWYQGNRSTSKNLDKKVKRIIEDFGDYRNRVSNKKKELKEQTLFKINYLFQSNDLIVYERTLIVRGSKQASPSVGIEHKSFHVYGQKIIDGITYELRSKDEGCSKNIAVLMAKSIKSFKALEIR